MSARLADVLRAYRVKSGLTQAGLSRAMGYDHAYVNRVERGVQGMSRHLAERAADTLDLSEWDRATLLAAAGHWPWPGVSLHDALSLMVCGRRLAVAS